MTLRYLDVCSGYSAFSVGATGLDVECVGYAEIDAFPAALLGHHYGATRARYMPDPDVQDLPAKERASRIALRKAMAALPDSQFGNRVTNFGDFTQIREDDVRGPVHLLTGGTPCQAFSVAGKRLGLDDPRGNLTLVDVGGADHSGDVGCLCRRKPPGRGRDVSATVAGAGHRNGAGPRGGTVARVVGLSTFPRHLRGGQNANRSDDVGGKSCERSWSATSEARSAAGATSAKANSCYWQAWEPRLGCHREAGSCSTKGRIR